MLKQAKAAYLSWQSNKLTHQATLGCSAHPQVHDSCLVTGPEHTVGPVD